MHVYQNSLRFFLMSAYSDLLSPHFARCAACCSSISVFAFRTSGPFSDVILPTNHGVQLNSFASLPRVHVAGSSLRSWRIRAMSSSETRGFSSRCFRNIGGSSTAADDAEGCRSGDAGEVVYESGEGEVGGGRWINVTFSGSSV